MHFSMLWFATVLALISNTLAVISLIKNGYEIELVGIWHAIYAEYRSFANLFYGVTVDFLFDIRLSRWQQDLLTIYLISNALVSRSIRLKAEKYLSGKIVEPGEPGYELQESSRNIRLLVNRWTFPIHFLLGPVSHAVGMMIVQLIHRFRLGTQTEMSEPERKFRSWFANRPISNIMKVTAKNIWPEYLKQLVFMTISASSFFYFNYIKLFYNQAQNLPT